LNTYIVIISTGIFILQAYPDISFHAQLSQRGIKISQEVLGIVQEEKNVSAVDMSNDDSVSDSDEKMEEDPRYPQHQQTAHDAHNDGRMVCTPTSPIIVSYSSLSWGFLSN
jgi:hypothetical protein